MSTYRSIFKWGKSNIEKPLDPPLISIIEEKLKLKIKFPINVQDHEEFTIPSVRLDTDLISQLVTIVGKENVKKSEYERANHAFGRSYRDILHYRKQITPNPPDLIISPTSEKEILEIMQLCHNNKIPIIPTGGLTSVTQGIEFPSGGIALDLSTHMHEILEMNEMNSSVTVQTGILGPKLEKFLNNSSQTHPLGYTCGHFPQSFEFSTVGGWIATRGAGQESTGYGKIEDMVLALRIITPKGIIDVKEFPARAEGPDLKQLIIGSEGAFGIITRATLKIRKRMDRQYIALMFKSWSEGIAAMRMVMQNRFGYPFVFRLSDPEETEISIKVAELAQWKDKILHLLGYHMGKRVLLLASISGDKDYNKLVKKKIKNMAKKNGGISIGQSPMKHWIKERFTTPYLRDTLMDHGILIDTLETTCNWSNIESVWKNVRQGIKSRPNTIAMSHISHVYENGANLYFIIMSAAKRGQEIEDYIMYQRKIIESILSNGGSLSHHHGIGRLYVPWFTKQLGIQHFNILQSIKNQVDPKGIMNPGVLGLN
jgi:alkyldihydroxyacetonephosphate synthase